jgi:hypothetical protein
VFPLFPYCACSISAVSSPSLCQLVSTTFGLTCRNPYPSRFVRYCPIPSTNMSAVSNVRKSRSQWAMRSHVSRIFVPAVASRTHPVPIPSYVTPPVSGTAQDGPVPHLVDPPRRSPITPPAPLFTTPADEVIGGSVGAVPEIMTQTSPVGGPQI